MATNNNLTNTCTYQNNDSNITLNAQVKELSVPPPESFSLAATLQLLDPFETKNNDDDDGDDDDGDDDDESERDNDRMFMNSNKNCNDNNTDVVYLMAPSYLQNWLFWAFHQNVKKGESNRLVEALKLAAQRFGLTPPQDASTEQLKDYVDPGPIDATGLSLPNSETNTNDDTPMMRNGQQINLYGIRSASSSCELLLSPNIKLKEGYFDGNQRQQNSLDAEFPELLRRVKSLPINNDREETITNGKKDENTGASMFLHPCDSIDVDGNMIMCCAVPYRFYETLRMSFGVMCDDGFAVSFQPYPKETKSLIHHHLYKNNQNNGQSIPIGIGGITSNGCHGSFKSSDNDDNNNNNNNINNNGPNGSSKQHDSYLSVVNSVVASSPSYHGQQLIPRARAPRRPIEFSRRIVMKSVGGIGTSTKYSTQLMNDASPMTKLLQEQERLAPRRIIPSVELYPIKLNYQIFDGTTVEMTKETKHTGFVLVSRRTKVYDAVQDLLKVTVPETSTSCKRLWISQQSSRCWGSKSTKLGDGYEVIDLATLDGKLKAVENKTKGSSVNSASNQTIPKLLIGEWIRTYQPSTSNESSNSHHDETDVDDKDNYNDKEFELDILVEVKRPNEPWPRKKLELESRVQVGDFVDAQDITGSWYEAIVQEVSDTSVKVHYLGWASRWNATLLKSRNDIDINTTVAIKEKRISPRLQPIAPLYTHCKRWRERLKEGSVLEVRDSQSKADRPRWYRGIVKIVDNRLQNGSSSLTKSIEGGAQLELLHDIIGSPASTPSLTVNENSDSSAGVNIAHEGHQNLSSAQLLILLNRKQQILVEVEQERENTNLADLSSIRDVVDVDGSNSFDSENDRLKPRPPFLRWVNLYGEEICEAGTHIKMEVKGDLAVVTLRYEYEAGRKPVEVMKSWNGMYGQGMVKEALRGTPPAPGAVGMHNLGNSCFLNSIIQCLNHIVPLTQYFLEGTYSKEMNRQNPLGSGGHVATAYAALLKEIWSGNYSALAPRLLKQTVASFAPQFRNSYQHDSQEFCQFLMDGLHEDCNRVTEKPYVEEVEGFGMEDEKAAIETWRKHLLRHDSIIVDRCQGMHRSHLTCTSCGRESIKFDVFSTVSLPIVLEEKEGESSGNTIMQVEDCIEKFLEGEQLDELNAWYCHGCKKHVCALKMIALWSVPDILILHLKRFQFENCSVSNNILRSKIDDTVKFPVDSLDLRKYILGPIDEDAPPVYKLFGVSEHVGHTANSGHYTATVRNCKDERWYRYNDAHVGETTGDAAVTGGAYLLFYQRARGNAKWAGMEKAMSKQYTDPGCELEKDSDGFQMVNKTKKKR